MSTFLFRVSQILSRLPVGPRTSTWTRETEVSGTRIGPQPFTKEISLFITDKIRNVPYVRDNIDESRQKHHTFVGTCNL